MASIQSPPDSTRLLARYERIRRFSDRIAQPLSPEDCMVQSMPDASPIRWHLAHTTWFFETFILARRKDYRQFDEQFGYLFNSYYNSIGDQFPRPQRGLISRPGLARTREYRRHVDEQILALLSADELPQEGRWALETGLNHEQQHQELMLTDIKHALAANPLLPVYEAGRFPDPISSRDEWIAFDEGLYEVGHAGVGFAFDNEMPRHRVFLHDFCLASRPVTCGEYLEFMADGGYQRPDHWLSLGWSTVSEQGWQAPLYWLQQDRQWMIFTLAGLVPVDPAWPVCHVSYLEADAFARWAGYRLPTEFEWEVACSGHTGSQFADRLLAAGLALHPCGEETTVEEGPHAMLGGVWEWTSSNYAAYPGYTPPDGAMGEYNGKFMCNQYILRGGSVASSSDHIRRTYRNFFPPDARWQFSGFRLAR
jgi:ergothioneine biosynthesis protein EgtB